MDRQQNKGKKNPTAQKCEAKAAGHACSWVLSEERHAEAASLGRVGM
jgi:hypothetical protein